jgi:hypothetical protein
MKTTCGTALAFLAGLLIAGCASHRNTPAYNAGDEVPPEFLTGPVAAVLTNLSGFSATVASTTAPAEGAPSVRTGQLLARDGRLLFQPTLAIKGKRAKTEGGLFFIWDENRHSGYVMSEALQGYAAIQANAPAPAGLNINNEGIKEDVNGHPCHRCQALVTTDDGAKLRLTLWEADDLHHFPIRIQTLDGLSRLTIDFSDVRQETPSRELFLPPDGFTAYASSVALMNELIVRDARLARKYEETSFDGPSDVRQSNWQPQPNIR